MLLKGQHISISLPSRRRTSYLSNSCRDGARREGWRRHRGHRRVGSGSAGHDGYRLRRSSVVACTPVVAIGSAPRWQHPQTVFSPAAAPIRLKQSPMRQGPPIRFDQGHSLNQSNKLSNLDSGASEMIERRAPYYSKSASTESASTMLR